MRKAHLLLSMILAGALVTPISADQGATVSGLYEELQAREGVRPAPARRPVMANPYDEVQSIQEAQKAAARENANAIEALSLQTVRRAADPDAVIKMQITRLLQRPADIDTAAALDLLNLDAGDVEVERIPAAEARRDWMVPSISMLQSGDTSIGAPENIFLKDWELIRNANGENVVGRVGDPLSRIRVRVGMILGEYGRIMAVRDTTDAYYLVLENGDRIAGRPGAG